MGSIVWVPLAMALVAPALPAQQTSHNWMLPPSNTPAGQRERMFYLTGNEFVRQCENSRVACTLYVQGVNDALLTATIGTDRDVPYCIPARATPDQLLNVVLNFMERNPGQMHREAPALIASALYEAWGQCS